MSRPECDLRLHGVIVGIAFVVIQSGGVELRARLDEVDRESIFHHVLAIALARLIYVVKRVGKRLIVPISQHCIHISKPTGCKGRHAPGPEAGVPQRIAPPTCVAIDCATPWYKGYAVEQS